MKIMEYDIPLDGLAVTVIVYMLSRENKLRNALIVAATHGILHQYELRQHCPEQQTVPTTRLGINSHRANAYGANPWSGDEVLPVSQP